VIPSAQYLRALCCVMPCSGILALRRGARSERVDLPFAQIDGAQIEQVFLALMMNAMDAMPKGGNLWISSECNQEDRLCIIVRDDGAGIPAEILPRIFEPFLTTKETGKGVGLGLAVSRSILERHDGTIEVQSELGRGTTFTVTLPSGRGKATAVTPAQEITSAAVGR
jgi:two-component system, NtrC family, sensor kinase